MLDNSRKSLLTILSWHIIKIRFAYSSASILIVFLSIYIFLLASDTKARVFVLRFAKLTESDATSNMADLDVSCSIEHRCRRYGDVATE